MLNGKALFCCVVLTVWQIGESARLPILQLGREAGWAAPPAAQEGPAEAPTVVRTKVREGVPPPLCAGRCAAPPAGPVCAFDATGTAHTFATLCELEAVSCRESTYYAITSLGEC